MKNKVNTEQFCGINLFNWNEWDYMSEDCMVFYNVQFLLPSMQKYNDMNVSKYFDGNMEIYDGYKVAWTGYVTDIPEVMEELNKR